MRSLKILRTQWFSALFEVLAVAATLIAIVAWASTTAQAQEASSRSRPNIVVIMTDDMGYSDIGSYGGEIETPNLDRLARGGLRFTQFYNTARCCPTRASLLTGLYPHQAGMGHMTANRGLPGYQGEISRNTVTIGEVLKSSGYRTYLTGKWHVCRDIRPHGNKYNWPLQRGFEKFYGTVTGAGSFYDPTTLCRQNTYITPVNDPEYQPSAEEGYYYTDAIAENAVTFLQQHQAETPEQPFFLYVPFTAAHWPMHAKEKDIAKYAGKYDQGYEPVRQARLARLKELGLIDPAWVPAPTVGDWEAFADKAWEARCMEVYAAMVDSMDQNVGRILQQLEASNQLDNTLILYLQDNGGCAELLGRSKNPAEPPADLKPLAADQLQPQIWPPMQTRDGQWVRTGVGVMPGPADTYIAYGEGWANVSNTPFRQYKHYMHEGGISTPLIAHWPQGIDPKLHNQLVQSPGHLIDIMATCVDLAQAEYPQEFGGKPIKPYEGVSLRPAFQGQKLQRPQPLFWEHEGNRAVRDGRWKLVAFENQPWELYDVEADRTESHNLIDQHPKRAAKLAAAWDTWAERADVLPLGGWRQQPIKNLPAAKP